MTSFSKRSFAQAGLGVLLITALPACMNAELVWEDDLFGEAEAGSAFGFSNANFSVIPVSQLSAFTLSGACEGNGNSVVLSGDVNASVTCIAPETGPGIWSETASFSAKSDGGLIVTATSMLADGTIGTATLHLIKDTQAPTIPVLSLMNPVVLFKASVPLSWTSSEVGSAGWDATSPYKISLYPDATCSGIPVNTVVQSNVSTLSGLVHGQDLSWRVTARDAAGNETVSACSHAPIELNSPTLTLADNAPATAGNAVSLLIENVSIATNLTGIDRYCLSENQSTAPASGTSTCTGGGGSAPNRGWELAPGAPSSVTLSVGNGTKTIYLWVADSQGNVKGGATASLNLTLPVPTVTGVSSDLGDGAYGVGQAVDVKVTFSESVTVVGTPTLTLNTTPTNRVINLSSSAGSVLTFTYTVVVGDFVSDLDYSSTSALALPAGATIRNADGTNAVLTLAAPGATGSLGDSKNLEIAAVVPVVTGVSSPLGNSSFNAGESIPLEVTFSVPVVVSGTPLLSLETGVTDRDADYASGTATNVLTFNYVVQAGDTSADLAYLSTGALFNSGGSSIQSVTGTNAVLTLPALGGTGSLNLNKSFVIDTTAPTVSLTAFTGGQVKVAGSVQTISWTAADANFSAVPIDIEFSNDSGSTWAVLATGESNDGSYSWTLPALNNTTLRIRVVATDQAGNIATAASASNFTIVSSAPSISHSLNGAYITPTAYPGNETFVVTLTNTSSLLALTLGAIANSNAAFTVSTDSCGGVIVPSGSCTLTLSFSPATVTTYSNTLTVPFGSAYSTGNTHSVSTPIVVNAASVTVGSAYTNGINWNDYITTVSPGALRHRQPPGAGACAGTEPNGPKGCVHGGEFRKFTVPGVTTCNGSFAISDALGAFDWVCDMFSGTAVFHSVGLKPTKKLADLLNAGGTAWRNNSIAVTLFGTTVIQSIVAPWWTNPITALSSGGTGALTVLGAIYTISGAQSTNGYQLTSAKQSLVGLPGSSLKYGGSATANCSALGAAGSAHIGVICTAGAYGWIEGVHIDSIPVSGTTAAYGLFSNAANFAKFTNVSVNAGTTAGIKIGNSKGLSLLKASVSNGQIGMLFGMVTDSLIEDLRVRKSAAIGIDVTNTDFSTFRNIVATENSNNGIYVDATSGDNRFFKVDVGANVSNGIFVGAAPRNSFVDVRAANNQNSGISLAGAIDTVLTQLLVSGNDSGIVLTLSATGNTIQQATVVQNNATGGLKMSGAGVLNNFISNSIFAGNTRGIELSTGAGNAIFHNITVADNSDAGIYLNSSSSNQFHGYLKVGNNLTDCNITLGTNPGLFNTTCASSVGSTSSLEMLAGADLSAVFVGMPLFDSAVAAVSGNSALLDVLYSSIAGGSLNPWFDFAASTRTWGRNTSTSYQLAAGSCVNGATCRVWDFALKVSDTADLRGVSGDGVNSNSTWVNNGSCPSEVNGNAGVNVHVDLATSPHTFLSHAIEIGNSGGNDNGLCEDGERCLYAPNAGYYIGHGEPSGESCTFSGSTISSVIMSRFPTNGY